MILIDWTVPRASLAKRKGMVHGVASWNLAVLIPRKGKPALFASWASMPDALPT
jgi:hypothetical protein